MKKLLFSFAIAAVAVAMVSCGNKEAARPASSDQPEQVEEASGEIETAPAELWTEEAVEEQVRKMYDRLNDMDKNGIINIRQLENEYCTSYYLSVRDAINKALEDVEGESVFYGDEEAYRFFAGMGTPLKIANISVDLLTGNMAQAQVKFKGADEENGFMRLELDMENGAWRVKNFDQPEAFGPGGYLKIMEDFALAHGMKYE